MNYFEFLSNRLREAFQKPRLPRKLLLYVTHRCNARCVMCNLWRTDNETGFRDELSIKELDVIFSNPLFAIVKHVDLNGGEPSLREDTAAIAELAIKKFPGLKRISMSTNGLLTDRLILLVKNILQSIASTGIKLSTVLSIHGIEDTLEKVNGVKYAFEKVTETMQELQPLQNKHFSLSVNCVLTDVNLLEVDRLIPWSRQAGVPIRFAIGEVRDRFRNADTASRTLIGADKRANLIRFLRDLSGEKSMLNLSAFRYHVLADMIEKGLPRSLSCHYLMGAAILGPSGDLHYCPHSQSIGSCRTDSAIDIYFAKENLDYRVSGLIQEKCPVCPPYSFNCQELCRDFLKYLRFLLQPSGKRL